jgi:hypothetical protein
MKLAQIKDQKLGIDNLKIVLDQLFDSSMKVFDVLKDGYQWTDTFAIVNEARDIPEIIAFGELAMAELADLEASETKDLHAWAEDNWNIADTEIDDRIREGLQLLSRIHLWAENGMALYPDVVAYGKKLLPYKGEK